MKRKLLIAFSAFALFTSGVVSASALWGTYKDYAIIRITVNGVPVDVSDVPAINMNNRTMIPIYLLEQAGINYTWDTATRTVDIKNQEATPEETPIPEPTTEPTPTPSPTEEPVEPQPSSPDETEVTPTPTPSPTPTPYVGPTDDQIRACQAAKALGGGTMLIPYCS